MSSTQSLMLLFIFTTTPSSLTLYIYYIIFFIKNKKKGKEFNLFHFLLAVKKVSIVQQLFLEFHQSK